MITIALIVFAFWFGRSFEVRQIGCHDTIYMTRIILLRCRFGKLMLNYFRRSDWTRDMHDHPWAFWSFILWRGYDEEVPSEWRYVGPSATGGEKAIIRVRPFQVIHRQRWWRHRVTLRDEKPALTLVLTGPEVRVWGFYTTAGWVDRREYLRKLNCI